VASWTSRGLHPAILKCGRDISLLNKNNILEMIERFETVLGEMKKLLEAVMDIDYTNISIPQRQQGRG